MSGSIPRFSTSSSTPITCSTSRIIAGQIKNERTVLPFLPTVSLSIGKSQFLGVQVVQESRGAKKHASNCFHSNIVFALLDLKAYMASKAKAVNIALDKAIPVMYPEILTESMRYTLLAGGRRLLPILCVAACEVVGGIEEAAMPCACAFEMLNTMSLIVDDLPFMDNDDLRRGVPTNHKKFGEAVAILAGVALLAYSFEYIARYSKGLDSQATLRAISCLGKAVGSAAAGQTVDMQSEGDSNVGLETLEYIHRHKTAAILEASVICGAIMGAGTEEEIKILGLYGRCAGLLLQVVDDILDVTQSSEELGKTAGKDLLTGKVTYPKLLGLDKAKEFAADLNRKAKEALSPFDAQKAAPLAGLADYIANSGEQMHG